MPGRHNPFRPPPAPEPPKVRFNVAPPPPKPATHQPTLSHLLKRTAFIIKCMLHQLPIKGKPSRTDYLKEKMKALRSHNYVNDLGMLEADVNRHWVKLESAMRRVEKERLGTQSLMDLATVLMDFGGRKGGLKAVLEMNSKGVLEVVF